MQPPDQMSPQELRASLGLASVFGLRMLGMFIILPVFALYARELPGGASQTLIGIALGVYGLTQACFQLPLGRLSDHWGRKRTIYLGLFIFAVGSLVAALANDIYMVTIGRAIQGAGAISSAVIALNADLTHADNRTKSMAIIGVAIGATFIVSMVAGPALDRLIGVPGIFLMTGVLALIAVAVVRFVVPDPPVAAATTSHRAAIPVRDILRDPDLIRLNFGIFALHGILMAMFVAVPFELTPHLAQANHWKMYLGVMLASVAIMVPVMLVSERRRRQKAAFIGGVVVIAAAQSILAAGSELFVLSMAGLVLFFAAFNLLEASLPSLVSRAAPPSAKGTAIGVYSTLQFVGTFVGATAGGWIAQYYGNTMVFAFCASVALLWLVVAAGMRVPARETGPGGHR
ncbi:MAG: MFS transporter [Betaproteobacteria bacterium]|nr:MAG: MFS transporter [Betaproteobacteria bacterium]